MISGKRISNNGLLIILLFSFGCNKNSGLPTSGGVSALTIVNAVPLSESVIPVINTTMPAFWFSNTNQIGYGSFFEYSVKSGMDTISIVQDDGDTMEFRPKSNAMMYYNVINVANGGIYSLFLCGKDSSAPDFLFTRDTVPYHIATDSSVGIRFVNLCAGVDPFSVNLEGNPAGSEVSYLSYKGITEFRNYTSNSTTIGYTFVITDAITGDSITNFALTPNTNFSNYNGYGLFDYQSGSLLTFKNITIAIFGSSDPSMGDPISTMLIEEY